MCESRQGLRFEMMSDEWIERSGCLSGGKTGLRMKRCLEVGGEDRPGE